MAVVTISQMLEAEASAIAQGWSEEQLLDLAGKRLGTHIGRHFPHPGTAVAYLGKGHNAGDAIVALHILRHHFGWRIHARLGYPPDQLAPLTRKKWSELGIHGSPAIDPHLSPRPLLLLDALLGSGAKGAIRPPLDSLANEINLLRNHAGAIVAAVDLPSGVDPDTGHPGPGCVTADATFMIANPKAGLLTPQATNHCGQLAVVPVEILTSSTPGDRELICPQSLDFAKSPRPFQTHKGQAGRVTLICGSRQYPGAAALTAIGALRGGAGLITLVTPESAAAAIAAKCPPEIIIRSYRSPREILESLESQADAIAIGPGLGQPDPDTTQAIIQLISTTPSPTVIDADALNLIARTHNQPLLGQNHILTPHPGEFRRLAPDLAELPRESAALEFTRRHPVTLLLKGARTLVSRANHPLWINSTGTPGMATGGQGDLLTGVIAARLAAGAPPTQAAAHSAWLCGRAAEIALQSSSQSEQSLTPGDIASHLGSAFNDWRQATR